MRARSLRPLIFSTLFAVAAAHADAVADLLAEYEAAGAGPFSAQAGEQMWSQPHPSKDGSPRACKTCHTADLRGSGKHAVTSKTIEPMAPSVDPKRLTKVSQIKKWFRRNCKWTLGRACTAQEKGDFLTFIQSQ
jgi:cytochrome c peroxidase